MADARSERGSASADILALEPLRTYEPVMRVLQQHGAHATVLVFPAADDLDATGHTRRRDGGPPTSVGAAHQQRTSRTPGAPCDQASEEPA